MTSTTTNTAAAAEDAQWEDVGPLRICVGDETPAGKVVHVDYYGFLGADIELEDGRSFHRGINDFVSRRRKRATR